jgi:glycosyltransferase involved in cell wall biosynthesis
VAEPKLPSFDLVVATVDRSEELRVLLGSLERQSHRDFRVLVVDQNDDDRIDGMLDGRPFDVVRLSAGRGLSHARNAALHRLHADVVAFPDDDCSYPADLLAEVGRRLAEEPGLDGLTGRAVDAAGRSSPSWEEDGALLTRDNLWNRAISYTIFLRREVVERVGLFDERLGLPDSSGEEIDYLIRAVDGGARIEYDPKLVVRHDRETRPAGPLGVRDGRSVGYVLRKHGYPARTVARMLVRPAGGALTAVAKRDRERARFHLGTLRGRLRGYRHAGADGT